ncbi:MAG: hypothetical protein ACK5MI_07325 [Mangrovibacterium sp.]
MKYFKYLWLIAFVAVSFISCNSWDNPAKDRGVYPNPTLENIAPAFFTEDFENSYVAFDVVMSEEDQAKIDGAYLQISYTPEDGEKSDAVKLQDLASFPAEVEISAETAIAAVGKTDADVKLNDVFSIEVITIVNGVETKSTAAIDAKVTCAFEPGVTVTSGTYKYASSSWETSGSVVIRPDDSDPYKVYINVDGLAAGDGVEGTGNEIAITIDPDTYAVTGDGSAVIVAETMGDYTNETYQLVSGSFDSCSGNYDLTFAINVDQGSFGSFAFEFTVPEADE